MSVIKPHITLPDDVQDLNPLDHMDRRKWSLTLAAIMSRLPMDVIHAIVAGGEDEFIRVSKPVLYGHAFRQADYKRVFAILRACSEQNCRIDPRLILGESAHGH